MPMGTMKKETQSETHDTGMGHDLEVETDYLLNRSG